MKLYKNKKFLYQKYTIEELSTYKIAKICGCTHHNILYWMNKHNIKRRKRYKPLDKRLYEKIDKKDNISECWKWIGNKNISGHGKLGKRHAHVIMYEIFYKYQIKSGEVIHHMCENPSCCNPFHLIKMTHKEHSIFHIGGANCHSAKFTQKEVDVIRNQHTGKYGEQVKLAKKYNVNRRTIERIFKNRTWRHK